VRVLLDNCVPWRLGDEISGHEVSSVIDLGWANLKNGALLDAMAGRFDALVTVDRSVPYQQRLHDRSFAVLLLRTKSNRLADLLPLVPALLRALDEVKPGEMREVKI
jgi:hypothetical protein